MAKKRVLKNSVDCEWNYGSKPTEDGHYLVFILDEGRFVTTIASYSKSFNRWAFYDSACYYRNDNSFKVLAWSTHMPCPEILDEWTDYKDKQVKFEEDWQNIADDTSTFVMARFTDGSKCVGNFYIELNIDNWYAPLIEIYLNDRDYTWATHQVVLGKQSIEKIIEFLKNNEAWLKKYTGLSKNDHSYMCKNEDDEEWEDIIVRHELEGSVGIENEDGNLLIVVRDNDGYGMDLRIGKYDLCYMYDVFKEEKVL